MAIETVVGNIDLAAAEPLGVWRVPLQDRVPLFEPVQFAFSQPRPELFGIGARFRAQLFQLRHRFDVRFGGELLWGREDALFVLKGFDVGGRHDVDRGSFNGLVTLRFCITQRAETTNQQRRPRRGRMQ